MDNRAKAWLGGLAFFVVAMLIAAFVIGGKENVDLLTLSTDAEVAAGVDDFGTSDVGEPGDVIIDDVTADGAFVTSTVGEVATPVPFATSTPFPTATPQAAATLTPIPTLEADAGAADDSTDDTAPTDDTTTTDDSDDTAPAEGTLASEATVEPTASAAEATETVTGIATPTPFGATPIPEPTPSGPGSFRVASFEAEGGTVAVNTMVVKVNEDGTGTVKGALSVTWPDGRTVGLKVDDSFTSDTVYESISVGVNAQYNLDSPNDADDIVEERGTMRIPKPTLRVGSICSRVCFTFDY